MRLRGYGVFACILLMLSTMGLAYAQWDDMVTVTSTLSFGVLDPLFVDPLECADYHTSPYTGKIVPGEFLGKEVGDFTCVYSDPVDSDGYKSILLELLNAYPGYIVICNFTLENVGTLDAHIAGLEIIDPSGTLSWDPIQDALVNGNGDPVIEITFQPGPVCNTLEPAETIEISMFVTLTQNAAQNTEYSFTATIGFEAA